MLHLSPLYRIDQGFNNWDVKIYRFRQLCMQFSVLIEFFSVFRFWMTFVYGFAVSNRPQFPSLLENIQSVGARRRSKENVDVS